MNKKDKLEMKVTEMIRNGQVRIPALTTIEEKIWMYLLGFIAENKKSPTNTEIAIHFEISRQAINIYLQKLQRKQYIRSTGKMRGIEIIKLTPSI